MIELLREPAVELCVVASGIFFLTGLLTGAWKYFHIDRSPTGTAPVYVDIAHRAALLYSFAALVIAVFAGLSAWSERVDLVAAALPLLFFALAIGSYLVHGVLRDTDNQMAKPHRFGRGHLHPSLMTAFMWALMAAEIGGFAVLCAGALAAL
jgi:hypothetical protein